MARYKALQRRSGFASIQGRLTAIALFSIIGAALAMGVAGYRLTVHFEKARYRDHFQLLASYLASNAEVGVLLENRKMLEELTKNMLAVRDVQIVEVSDGRGELLVRNANPRPPGDLGSVSAAVFSSRMGQEDAPFVAPGNEEVLGRVTIFYSQAGLAQLKKLLAFRFALISLGLALAAAVLYWLFSRTITAPLLELLGVAGQVSRGRMDVRAGGGSLQEINTLAGAINEMLDALEAQRKKLEEAHTAMARQQVLAEVGRFSMIVAHEIKNPLAIIKGSLDMFRKEGTSAELKSRMMGFLDEEIERINRLIEDFLLFARPREAVLQPQTAGEFTASLAQRIRLLGGEVEVAATEGGAALQGVLRCDPGLLERALFNLVRNGMEAAGKEGGVRVAMTCTTQRLILTIEDSGPGIAPETLPRVFEPFFSTKAKGTGLGLAIAKEVIQGHGGTIAAANRPEGGASFTVKLPIKKQD
ncbi:MAG: ATP-binding protein [Deltaproteobacteria bacterium]|nr:ATP-binding protein [Deltaproteobacteria bacterium]